MGMYNINRDYLISVNLKNAKVTSTSMSFYNTDKGIANIFVKLQIAMSQDLDIKQYVNMESAENYRVKLLVIKPKTNALVELDGVLINPSVDGNNAVYLFDMPNSFTNQVGTYQSQLQITCDVNGQEEMVTSDPFTYTVKQDVATGLNGEIESNPDLPILKQLIEEVKSFGGSGGSGHNHTNKIALDKITEDKLLSWDNKLDNIPLEYVTESELDSKGYLTEHQNISGKVDKVTGKSLIADTEITRLSTVTNYTLPIATASTLGGIKVGTGLSISAGVLSATGGGVVDSVEWSDIQNKPSVFTPTTHSHSYNDLSDKPIIPTISNDLTSVLKANYDTAYTHSQSNHAPSTAQKNSDITKEEIESKLTGVISSHSHEGTSSGGTSNTSLLSIEDIALKKNLKVNVINKLTIPTFDNKNQPVHPKVLYFENGWGGYKYWMVFTPYTNSYDAIENPSIVVSDNGVDWVVPNGLTNPIDKPLKGYLSDPHIVYNPTNNQLECWYRNCITESTQVKYEHIYRKKSSDGINWSEKELLHSSTNTTLGECLSPVIMIDEGKYKIWTINRYTSNGNRVQYFESTDGANWVFIRNIDLNKDYNQPWHFDIIKTDIGYEFIGNYTRNNVWDDMPEICYSKSLDNITYDFPKEIITTGDAGNFDDGLLYRPSLLKINNKYSIYYSAKRGNNIAEWGTGLLKIGDSNIEKLHDLIKVKYKDIVENKANILEEDILTYELSMEIRELKIDNTIYKNSGLFDENEIYENTIFENEVCLKLKNI